MTFQTILFILLVILILFSFRKKENEILSIENTNILRGIFALCIIIFHVAKEGEPLFFIYDYLGIVVVGAFFFISAFGSMKGYMNRNNYSRSFLINRFTKLIIPYLIITVIYWLFNLLIGNYYSFIEVIIRIFKYIPIVTYSWFIVSIIYHYLIFYILMKLCRDNHKLLMYIYVLLLIVGIVCSAIGIESNYLIQIVFSLGIIYAYYEKNINKYLDRYGIVLFVVSFVLTIIVKNKEVNKVLFVMMILSLLSVFSLDNKILRYFGKISLEIYLFQGLAKMFVRRFIDGSLFIQDMLIYVLCFLLSIGFNIGYSYISKRLFKK